MGATSIELPGIALDKSTKSASGLESYGFMENGFLIQLWPVGESAGEGGDLGGLLWTSTVQSVIQRQVGPTL